MIGFRELELQEIVTCSGTFISWARKIPPLHKGEEVFSLFDHTKLITHHNFPSSTNSNGPHLAKMWGRHVGALGCEIPVLIFEKRKPVQMRGPYTHF